MGRLRTPFRRDPPVEDLTPLQRGLRKAVSLNYFEIGPVETRSIDRMWNIGLVRVELDGSIVPTEMEKGIIEGTIRTRDGTPPFLAGLVRLGRKARADLRHCRRESCVLMGRDTESVAISKSILQNRRQGPISAGMSMDYSLNFCPKDVHLRL